MDPLTVTSLIAGGASLANTVANWFSQSDTNKVSEGLMRESWAREDNAVQRRVSDLTRAGLSPTLAAGSSASSSGPISLTAPQSDFDPMSVANSLIAGQRAKADIAATNESARKIAADAALSKREVAINQMMDNMRDESGHGGIWTQAASRFQNALNEARRIASSADTAFSEAMAADANAKLARHNLAWYVSNGVPSNVDGDTMGKVAQGRILGLDPKSSVAAGAVMDQLQGLLKGLVLSKTGQGRMR